MENKDPEPDWEYMWFCCNPEEYEAFRKKREYWMNKVKENETK